METAYGGSSSLSSSVAVATETVQTMVAVAAATTTTITVAVLSSGSSYYPASAVTEVFSNTPVQVSKRRPHSRYVV